MVEKFHYDEEGYLNYLKYNKGFVYNDFPGNNVTLKKLHHYNCSRLHNLGGGKYRTNVPKVCSPDYKDLIDWITAFKGPKGIGYSNCPCMEQHDYKTINIEELLNNTQIIHKKDNINKNLTTNQAFVKKFANKLIDIYVNRKIPKYLKYHHRFGFTKKSLEEDKNKLFQLIVIASFDQQPFTWNPNGWELIWEEIPEILKNLGLYTLKGVREKDVDKIENLLKTGIFYNKCIQYRIRKNPKNTSYAKTLKDAFNIIEEKKLHNKMLEASTSEEIKSIYNMMTNRNINNIGKTIASKILMYTLRELRIGKARPEHFDLVVDALIDEYHNNKLAEDINKRYGESFIREVIVVLKRLGDPFAIDALYFVDRDAPELKSELFNQ